MVFQTAPPQPASKARMTCSPVLVGGADASQKGLGEAMPAKFTARFMSDISRLQLARNGHPCALPVRDCAPHFASAVHAVSAGKVFWIRRLAGLALDNHPPAIECHAA